MSQLNSSDCPCVHFHPEQIGWCDPKCSYMSKLNQCNQLCCHEIVSLRRQLIWFKICEVFVLVCFTFFFFWMVFTSSGWFSNFTSSPVHVSGRIVFLVAVWAYSGSADLTCSETDLITLPLPWRKRTCMERAGQLVLEDISMLLWV